MQNKQKAYGGLLFVVLREHSYGCAAVTVVDSVFTGRGFSQPQ